MKKYTAGRFANKYRIESARLRNWDYARNGKYFITICTGNRECYFGTIENKKVNLTEIGILADKFWLEIPDHFNYIKLDEYIIMPNHIHGIIIIDKPDDVKNMDNVETLHATSLHYNNMDKNKNEQMAKISPKPGSLSTIIRSYKSVVTKNARLIYPEFTWQSRYYDQIIWNQKSFNNIRNYIKRNPEKWEDDELSTHA